MARLRSLRACQLAIFLVVSFPFAASSHCFDAAAQRYGIKTVLLKAIAHVESRHNRDALNCANHNGSCDYGLMQINLSAWRAKLKEFDISLIDLSEPCQNLHFGAWILAQNFASHGRNWNSVGAYNAGFAKNRQAARDRYISLVQAAITHFNKEI